MLVRNKLERLPHTVLHHLLLCLAQLLELSGENLEDLAQQRVRRGVLLLLRREAVLLRRDIPDQKVSDPPKSLNDYLMFSESSQQSTATPSFSD